MIVPLDEKRENPDHFYLEDQVEAVMTRVLSLITVAEVSPRRVRHSWRIGKRDCDPSPTQHEVPFIVPISLTAPTLKRTHWLRLLALLFLATLGSAFASEYTISTIAGGPPPTPLRGLSASIGRVTGVAADSDGNVYFGTDLACVFTLDSEGILTRFAGTGHEGFSGDGGPALAAQIGGSLSLAFDADDNLYIGDGSNGRVRKVDREGIITTIAGGGTDNRNDGILATEAYFEPRAVTVDPAGNLYIGAGQLLKVTTQGLLYHLGGNDIGFPNGVGGVAIDADGSVFVTEPERNLVKKLAPDGTVTIIPSNVDYPHHLSIDAAGNLYVADTDRNRIARIAPSGGVSTVAGSGDFYRFGFSGDGGPAAGAGLSFPRSVAVDSAGNIVVADTGNHRVRKITNGIIDTIAGNGSWSFSGDGGPATVAQLGGPAGIAFDEVGNLYFSDLGNHRIRRISREGNITTVAGNGTAGNSGDGGPALQAEIFLPTGVGADLTIGPNGTLYFVDEVDNSIRSITSSGIIHTVLMGTFSHYLAIDAAGTLFTAEFGNIRKWVDGAQITVAEGNGPLAVDLAGNVYFVAGSRTLHKLSPDGVESTVASFVSLQFGAISAITIDRFGTLYMAFKYSSPRGSALFRVSAGSDEPVLIAGSMTTGYSGDGGDATDARISVSGMAVDDSGNVYITDDAHRVIRVLRPEVVGPEPLISAITNGATNRPTPLAPGEIVVLYGPYLGPPQLTTFSLNANGRVGTELAETRIMFNGIPGPILYTSPAQVGAIVPYGPVPAQYEVVASYKGRESSVFLAPAAPTAPGIFAADATGSGQAAAVDLDGTLNSASHPVEKGGVITLYATGEGVTSPAGVDGMPAAAPLPSPSAPVSATIGGLKAVVQYAGGAPGFVAGLMQVNLIVPPNVISGLAVPVVLTIGGVTSQANITIAIAQGELQKE